MRRTPIGQLRNLRHAEVPAEVLARGRERLLSAMRAAPMTAPPRAAFAFAWKPAAGMAVVVLAVAASGGVAFAAHGSVPGDRLYRVKIAAEETRVRLTLSNDARFKVRARQAERRLAEAGQVMARADWSEQDRGDRLQLAMERYQTHLFAMNEIAVKFGAVPAKPKTEIAAFRSVDRMLEWHEALIESASSAAVAAAEDSLELEANMMVSAGAKVPGTVPADLEHRVRERAERLRAKLESRRVRAGGGDNKDDQSEEREQEWREPQTTDSDEGERRGHALKTSEASADSDIEIKIDLPGRLETTGAISP